MTAQTRDKIHGIYLSRAGIITLFLISAIFSISGVVFAESSDLSATSTDSGWFRIESAPQVGEVSFDGKSYGLTPALIMVSADAPPNHEVTIRMEGYEEYTKEIPYNPGRGETVPIVLDATQTLGNIVEFLNKN